MLKASLKLAGSGLEACLKRGATGRKRWAKRTRAAWYSVLVHRTLHSSTTLRTYVTSHLSCSPKLKLFFLVDLDDTFGRIVAFGTTAAILVGIGYLYSKFRSRIEAPREAPSEAQG